MGLVEAILKLSLDCLGFILDFWDFLYVILIAFLFRLTGGKPAFLLGVASGHYILSRYFPTPSSSSWARVHAVRLTPGQEIKSALFDYCRSNRIGAAIIVTCVGSVNKAHLRFAYSPSNDKKASGEGAFTSGDNASAHGASGDGASTFGVSGKGVPAGMEAWSRGKVVEGEFEILSLVGTIADKGTAQGCGGASTWCPAYERSRGNIHLI